ncbi:glycosyltransferase [Protaetiibacter larvae]|uniref:Glycosyltransferase n=1 Tax=Protaetiibacter larvae TaxID=2592654 RepID=A0A5C1Y4I9_9MICO|nr:glycosyltransferase [Protaetiibacter larvae]QEO08620.1 glycosyltransferase [Protaetiibacter larvae]
MKVLHFSTHDEACGIGKYQEAFLEVLAPSDEVENRFFDLSPNVIRTLPDDQYAAAMDRLAEEVRGYDILHVQHEWGFYSRDEMGRAVAAARAAGARLIVTLHTSPGVLDLAVPARAGISPRAFLNHYRARAERRALDERVIAPLRAADLLIVHNSAAFRELVAAGVDPARIRRLVLPAKRTTNVRESTRIREGLRVQKDDVVLCTIGFLHRYKGVDAAIKALTFLPDNYKLAVIGGINPTSHDVAVYDELTDLVRELGLKDRVYITGYVEGDLELDAMVRECDIAVYPYDGEYYSQVTSAALTTALSNSMPTVAYPTETFRELNALVHCIELTDTFAYYELARVVQRTPTTWPSPAAIAFTERYSYERVSEDLLALYREALAG